eukprot:jgi/Tetstr1/446893/TSEL_034351.t1
MEEPVRSAKTASHVETIEALKALATNRDFPTDMRSLSHRLLDTPVYAVSYNRAGTRNKRKSKGKKRPAEEEPLVKSTTKKGKPLTCVALKRKHEYDEKARTWQN